MNGMDEIQVNIVRSETPPVEPTKTPIWPSPTPRPPASPAPPKRRRRILVGAALLISTVAVGGVSGYVAAPKNSGGYAIYTSNDNPGAAVLPSGMTVPSLVRRVSPSVVSIDVRTSSAEEQGTGMILQSNGLVLTNAHVVHAALSGATMTVTRTGATEALPATLVGLDAANDVALIRITNGANLPAITFGKSDGLEVGDSVVAIGNALGLAAGTPTVTQGIVSALGRTVTAGSATSSETLSNLIQTDAAINPGNSGGPLLDSNGHVIGMNTAVAGTMSDGTSAQNIGFAIPSAKIESLLASLMKGGTIPKQHGYLGVKIMTMTSQLQSQYGLTIDYGALVIDVVSGSSADNAGIQAGDIITALNGTKIRSADAVSTFMAKQKVGAKVIVELVSQSGKHTVTATLGVASN